MVWHDKTAMLQRFRVFDPSGEVYTGDAEIVANAFAKGDQARPSVAALSTKEFVAVWQSDGQDGDGGGIFGRRFDANGQPTGGEFQVSSYTKTDQIRPDVAADGKGGFVVAWDSNGQDGDEEGIFAQRFAPGAKKAGKEFGVNVHTDLSQRNPAVAAHKDGTFAVAWEAYKQPGGSDLDVMARCWDAGGKALSSEVMVNTTTKYKQMEPDIASMPDGGWYVVWMSLAEDGDGYGVYGQKLDAKCKKSGKPMLLNTHTKGEQSFPSVISDGLGQLVVAWQSSTNPGLKTGYYSVYSQRLDASGNLVAGEQKVSDGSQVQWRPQLAMAADGQYLAGWQYSDTAAKSWRLRVAAHVPQWPAPRWRLGRGASKSRTELALAARPDGVALALWRADGLDGDGGTIVARRTRISTCAPGACVCEPHSARCDGDKAVSCDPVGAKQTSVDCAASKSVCRFGQCVVCAQGKCTAK